MNSPKTEAETETGRFDTLLWGAAVVIVVLGACAGLGLVIHAERMEGAGPGVGAGIRE